MEAPAAERSRATAETPETRTTPRRRNRKTWAP